MKKLIPILLLVLAMALFLTPAAMAGVSLLSKDTSSGNIIAPNGHWLVLTNSRTGAGQKDTSEVRLESPRWTILEHQTAASSVLMLPLTIFVKGGGDSVQYAIQQSFDGTNWIDQTALGSVVQTAFIQKVLVAGAPRLRIILGNDLSSSGASACKLWLAYPSTDRTASN